MDGAAPHPPLDLAPPVPACDDRLHNGDETDVDRDGLADVVAVRPLSERFDAEGGVAVWRGRGGGAFGTARYFAVSSFPAAVAVADLDGDGLADVVTGAGGPMGVADILLGLG